MTRSLLIHTLPSPLIGGEVHFWRHDPAHWGALLDAVKSIGLTFVSTYVCWQFHEIEEGVHDLEGTTDPRRDLHRFFTLARDRGLGVFARPGPYIYAEWRNQGVPDHAAPLHKANPDYRQKAVRWLQDVAAALLPHLASRGGPVFLVQADNESDPAIHVHAESLGLGETPGPFQEWLRERYGDINTLDTAWNSHLTSFEEARAVLAGDIPDSRRAFLDTCDFRYHLAADHADFAVKTLRALGIDCPVCLNTWPGHDAQDWWTFSRLADFHGIDPYPANLYRGYSGEHRYHRERFRYLRALGKFPFIAEFGAGVWRGQEKVTGVFDPEHYRLAALTALAGGVQGWNWYMLAGRDEWLMAPVQPDGQVDPGLGPVFMKMAKVFRALDPASREVAVSFAATWSPRHAQVAELDEGRNQDEVRIALHDTGVAHDFVDVDRDRDASPPVLFYTGPAWLSRAGQEGLVNYVAQGGVLVFHRTLPVQDEDLSPLNLLDLPLQGRSGRSEINLGKGRVLILGHAPSPARILDLLVTLDASPPCVPLTPGIQATLLVNTGAPALILVNPGEEEVAGRIRLDHPALPDGVHAVTDPETDGKSTLTLKAGILELPIPPRGGRVVLF